MTPGPDTRDAAPPQTPPHTAPATDTGRIIAVAALAAAVIALTWRYAAVAGASLTYNEAIYVDLARHPWHSSFYPDDLFVRHPPLWFAFFAAWQAVTDEAWPRLPGLLFSIACLGLSWDAARRRAGPGAAATVAVTIGASFLVWAYAIQATMYGAAAALVALGVWLRVTHRPKAELWTWTALALTHFAGFLFIAYALYRSRHGPVWDTPEGPPRDTRRPAWSGVLGSTWPAWLWLAVASPLGLQNEGGGVIGRGPVGQGLRTFFTAGQWFTHEAPIHLGAVALVAFTLLPFLVPAWRDRALWPGLAVPAGVWAAFLLVAAPFARYGLLLLPLVAVAGACAAWQLGRTRRVALGVVLALLSVPVAASYLAVGFDPRDEGDVPGILEWQEVATAAPAFGEIWTSGPTSIAAALEPHGWSVVDASQGPWLYVLRNGDERLIIHRIDDPREMQSPAIVPAWWDVAGTPCLAAGRLEVHADPCPTTTAPAPG